MYGGNPQQGGGGGADDAALMAALAAAAAQDQRPNYYRYLEGLLPLVLLLILGGFIAVRMGVIPLNVFGSRSYNVLILTDDPEAPEIKALQNALQTGAGGYLNITAIPYTTELDPEFPISADQLANYDVIILYQVRNKMLTLSQRDELSTYLKGGGRLIIVRDSGTCYPANELLSGAVTGEAICNGWGGGIREDLSKYIPVRCIPSDGGSFCKEKTISNVRLRFINPNDELNPNAPNPYYPSKDERISRVTVLDGVRPEGTGRVIAKFQVMSGDSVKETYYAIIVGEGLPGYKVVWLNYDPAKFPLLLYKIINWMG